MQSINASASPEVQINENFDTLDFASVYGKDPRYTQNLTWVYYGGRWSSFAVTGGLANAITLTDAADNYLVVNRSTGALSSSTSTTNWNDTANYARVYKVTTAGGVVTVVEDHRSGSPGVMALEGGQGDVIGPASATDGDIARFDGSSGKLLKAGIALSADGTLAGNSDSVVATQKAVKTYADALIGAADAMVYKGATDCSANPNYPAADAGHTYRVSVAGKIGGASGKVVEIGDFFICNTDGTASGNEATVGTKWNVIQTNLDGAVIGPASATDGLPPLWDGATGKLLKNATAAQVRASIGLDTGNSPTFSTLTLSGGAGAASLTLPATGRLYLDGGGDTYIGEGAANRINIVAGATELIRADSGTGIVSILNASLSIPGGTITTSGSTALSLATTGGTGFQVADRTSADGCVAVRGGVTGSSTVPWIYPVSSGTNVGIAIGSKGSGSVLFYKDLPGTPVQMFAMDPGTLTIFNAGQLFIKISKTSPAQVWRIQTDINEAEDIGIYDETASGQVITFSKVSAGVSKVRFATIGTTGSAANAFINNADTNSLLRSTSTERDKIISARSSIESDRSGLVSQARHLILGLDILDAVHKGDNKPYLTLSAENVAALDPRFATFDKDGMPEWVQYPHLVAPLSLMAQEYAREIDELKAWKAKAETAMATKGVMIQ